MHKHSGAPTRMISQTLKACRSCGGDHLKPFLDLGETPLADRLLTSVPPPARELTAPLAATFCEECTLVQITETVDPNILFCEEYPYFSSVSKSLIAHFRASAEHLIETRELGPDSLVIEAASNDGYMLRNFKDRGIPVLGIDPADGPAEKAQREGIRTLKTFFGKELAVNLRDQGHQADVFLANNVLAHVPDLNGFVGGIATLLKDDGVAVIECPYLLDLVDHVEFDTIYHQHLCYYSVTALDNLFRRHELYLNDVKRVAIHGGSLRLFVEKRSNQTQRVRDLLETERARGIDNAAFYQGFADRIATLKADLLGTLRSLKAEGKRIVGYGAAAKACTLMSYCEIDGTLLDYVCDLNTFKHNKLMGGNHLKIVPPTALADDKPDYVLILAWNFAREIIEQQSAYRDAGGKFIVPIPKVRVVS